MNTRTLWVIIGLIIIIGAGWYLWKGTASAPTNGTPSTGSDSSGMPVPPEDQSVVVRYTAEGFSPASVSIPAGASVTFVNETSEDLWVASGPHPAHTLYDGTSRDEHCVAGYAGPASFDACRALSEGESYTFTFAKTGTWPYHNHSVVGDFGSVTVTPVASDTEVNVDGSVSI